MSEKSANGNPSVVESVKTSALEHLTETAHTTRDAVTSGGWAYPLLGIVHLATHPRFFRPFIPTILKCIATAIGVTAGLFLFTYLPQVAFCAILSGPLAFIAAALLVLGESYLLTLVLCKHILHLARDQLFDAVLVQQGGEQLVAKGREISSTSTGAKKLGAKIAQPFTRLNKTDIIRYLVSLPLNALPVVGTLMFLLYNGEMAGPQYHRRYFDLKEFDEPRREGFIRKRKAAYTAFGATALGLQLIPIVGVLFVFSSTVGAALWASQIERKPESGPNVAPVPEENEVPVEM